MAVAKRLAGNFKSLGAPCARPHEDRLVPVAEEIVHAQRTADGRVRTDVDAECSQLFSIAIDCGGRQTEIGDAVAQHTADLLHPLKDRDAVSLLRELHRDDDARGTRADDGDVVTIVGLARENELIEVGVGDVVLDARDLDRRAAPSLNAVALALRVVVADEGAENAHRIIVVKHCACFVDFPIEEETDHLRDVGLNRASLDAAERLFTLETAACLVDYMNGHGKIPFVCFLK